MAVELSGVIVGGVLGLVGGFGGVLLGHHFSRKRDHITRSIEGLRQVVDEMNRFSRIALFFEQQINMGPDGEDPLSCAKRVCMLPEWRAATHELQATHWQFPCLAFLPEASDDFKEISRLMLYVCDPYSRKPWADTEPTNEQAWSQIKGLFVVIQSKVQHRLKQLL